MEQIASFIEELSAEIRKHWFQQAPEQHSKGSFRESVLGFIHAVDWTEPWLVSLLVSHVIAFFFVIGTRKNNNIQMVIFFCALFGVYMAERLNRLLARNWTSFARQPYFDHNGIFMSTVWSGPLLLISCVILVNGLVSLCALMVKWKRAELRHRARAAASSVKEHKTE